MTIQYDGTNYYGWQFQLGVPTIQQIIQEKMCVILNEPKKIQGAGRTDSGVHALYMVAHFKYRNLLDIPTFQRSMNSLLPADIRITNVEIAPPKFNSRFSALWKEYAYYLYNGTICPPFIYRYAWHYPNALNLELMQEAANYFLGHHDFSLFGTGGIKREDTLRSIDSLIIEKQGELLIFRIRAKSFLRHMVRWIVGTLVEVGEAKKTIAELPGLFQEKKYGLVKFKAPPNGLFLIYIEY
ncbi:MAG: tRNA pseudouridine(38-40) synthase TruA [Candidatus Fischerbacteria bacterium RBG_13_37_8]|uniref:tRNA pseudouridine synthase A n=1 Tax=Candidatus Fischerbacteria bacterium RBG_13_37_8 TaxID=1817863 RepID=A0A1F5VGQ1_9BACT|nr:MAG: tRNA pseudouridine(38-40) synthase TruA [Candidatus Fischerbacteria bacterium RBG_13_37_8]